MNEGYSLLFNYRTPDAGELDHSRQQRKDKGKDAAVLLFLAVLQLLQCPAKLVRTRGGFVPAADALEFFDYLVRLLPFHQTTNRLQVAAATAYKRNLLYHILLINRHINQLRAGALGFVKSVGHILFFTSQY